MSNGQAEHGIKELYGMDFYVPAFEIKVGGKKLELEIRRDIVNVSYTDSLERMDSFSFTVTNWDAERRGFKYLDFDKSPFKVGNVVEIFMGYSDDLRKMIYGEIKTLEPNFPPSGNPTLNIRGLNILARLGIRQETHHYKERTDGHIARQIARRLNLKKGTIKEGNKHEFIAQQNRFDIVFLMERARRIGYEVSITEDGELNFQPSTHTTQKNYVLEWGKSLIHFRPTLSTAKQVSEVVVRGWNPKKKQPIIGRAQRRDLETKGLGTAGITQQVENAFNQSVEITVDRPIRDKREADQLAKEKLEQIAKGLLAGEGSTIGLPDLRAGSLIEIRNLGRTFSGNYYVTDTTHTIGEGGYSTRFSVRREEKQVRA